MLSLILIILSFVVFVKFCEVCEILSFCCVVFSEMFQPFGNFLTLLPLPLIGPSLLYVCFLVLLGFSVLGHSREHRRISGDFSWAILLHSFIPFQWNAAWNSHLPTQCQLLSSARCSIPPTGLSPHGIPKALVGPSLHLRVLRTEFPQNCVVNVVHVNCTLLYSCIFWDLVFVFKIHLFGPGVVA